MLSNLTKLFFAAILSLAVFQMQPASAQMSKDDVGGLLTGKKGSEGGGSTDFGPSEVAGPDLPEASMTAPESMRADGSAMAAEGFHANVTPQAIAAFLEKHDIKSELKNADSEWPYLLIKASKYRWMSIYFRQYKGRTSYLWFYIGYRLNEKQWGDATYEKLNQYNSKKIFSSYKYINKGSGTKHHALVWSLWTVNGTSEEKVLAYYRTLMGEMDSFDKFFGY